MSKAAEHVVKPGVKPVTAEEILNATPAQLGRLVKRFWRSPEKKLKGPFTTNVLNALHLFEQTASGDANVVFWADGPGQWGAQVDGTRNTDGFVRLRGKSLAELICRAVLINEITCWDGYFYGDLIWDESLRPTVASSFLRPTSPACGKFSSRPLFQLLPAQ